MQFEIVMSMLEKQIGVVKVDGMPLKQTLFVLLALVEFYLPTNIHLGAAHDLAHIMKSMRKVMKSRKEEGLQASRDFMRSRFQFEKRRSNSERIWSRI